MLVVQKHETGGQTPWFGFSENGFRFHLLTLSDMGDGIFRAERRFLLFKDQLLESGCQKTKENIIPGGKLRLVENDPNTGVADSA